MRILILILSLIIILGCSKDKVAGSHIELLFVDYQTNQFEGGAGFNFNIPLGSSDSIDLIKEYKEPGDFGSITFYYNNSSNVIFKGDIIWMGKGELHTPSSISPVNSYATTNVAIPTPNSSDFQVLHPYYDSIPFTSIWNAIDELEIVNQSLSSGKKIGIFLYQPSVGVGDPADWDWVIIMNK